jgi:mitogen-activated protein kinase 1/3
MVDSPNSMRNNSKYYYMMWQTMFEIDTKYVRIKPIGSGAYGIVCSAINQEKDEKVAIRNDKQCLRQVCGCAEDVAS